MKKRLKVASLVTLVCFLTTQSVWGAPMAAIEMAGQRELPSYLSIDIPAELGTVDALYEAPAGANPQFILHIQNAHANYQAQMKIKQLLQHMNKKYGFNTIFVEGASEKLDADYLRLFPDQERNEKLCDELAKRGELTGAELFLMEQAPGLVPRSSSLEQNTNQSRVQSPESRAEDRQVEALGIEQASLYRSNYEALKKVFGAEADVNRFFKGFDGKLEKVSSQVFTPEARELIADWKRFEQGRRDFMPFVKSLTVQSRKILKVDLESLFAQVGWPQISRLLVIQRLEKDMDKAKGIQEQAALIKMLRTKDVSKELLATLENFNEGSISVGKATVEVSPREVLERLAAEAGPKGFKFSDYPAFSLFAGYVTLRSELDPKALFDEIEYLFTQMLDTLAKKPQQKALLALYRDGELLRKLLHLELNRAQWREVVNAGRRMTVPSLVARLKNAVQTSNGDLGLGTRDSEKRGTSTSPSPSAAALGDVMPPAFGKKMDALFTAGLEFYDFAHKREAAFYKDMQAAMSQKKITRAILITGGFHTDGMSDLFRENAISYGIVTPRLSEKSDEHLYQKVMLQDQNYPFSISYLEAVSRLQPWKGQEAQGIIPAKDLEGVLAGVMHFAGVDLKGAVAIFNASPAASVIDYKGSKGIVLSLQTEKGPQGEDLYKIVPRSESRVFDDVKMAIRKILADQAPSLIEDFDNFMKVATSQMDVVQWLNDKEYFKEMDSRLVEVLNKVIEIIVSIDEFRSDPRALTADEMRIVLSAVLPVALSGSGEVSKAISASIAQMKGLTGSELDKTFAANYWAIEQLLTKMIEDLMRGGDFTQSESEKIVGNILPVASKEPLLLPAALPESTPVVPSNRPEARKVTLADITEQLRAALPEGKKDDASVRQYADYLSGVFYEAGVQLDRAKSTTPDVFERIRAEKSSWVLRGLIVPASERDLVVDVAKKLSEFVVPSQLGSISLADMLEKKDSTTAFWEAGYWGDRMVAVNNFGFTSPRSEPRIANSPALKAEVELPMRAFPLGGVSVPFPKGKGQIVRGIEGDIADVEQKLKDAKKRLGVRYLEDREVQRLLSRLAMLEVRLFLAQHPPLVAVKDGFLPPPIGGESEWKEQMPAFAKGNDDLWRILLELFAEYFNGGPDGLSTEAIMVRMSNLFEGPNEENLRGQLRVTIDQMLRSLALSGKNRGGITTDAGIIAGARGQPVSSAVAAQSIVQAKSSFGSLESRRVIGHGDVHGELAGLKEDLRQAKLIDENDDWIGGADVLLQLGDFIDRGPQSKEVDEFLRGLQRKARDQKGDVLRLIGNHEMMLMRGMLGDDPQLLNWVRNLEPGEQKDRFVNAISEGMDALREAIRNDGTFGAVYKAVLEDIKKGDINAAGNINGRLFLHAGLRSPMRELLISEIAKKLGIDHSQVTIEQIRDHINKLFMEAFRDNDFAHPLFGNDGIFWVRNAMESMQAGLIPQVIAHTPPMPGEAPVQVSPNASLINVDVGLFVGYGGGRGFIEMDKKGNIVAHRKNADAQWEVEVLGHGNAAVVVSPEVSLEDQIGKASTLEELLAVLSHVRTVVDKSGNIHDVNLLLERIRGLLQDGDFIVAVQRSDRRALERILARNGITSNFGLRPKIVELILKYLKDTASKSFVRSEARAAGPISFDQGITRAVNALTKQLRDLGVNNGRKPMDRITVVADESLSILRIRTPQGLIDVQYLEGQPGQSIEVVGDQATGYQFKIMHSNSTTGSIETSFVPLVLPFKITVPMNLADFNRMRETPPEGVDLQSARQKLAQDVTEIMARENPTALAWLQENRPEFKADALAHIFCGILVPVEILQGKTQEAAKDIAAILSKYVAQMRSGQFDYMEFAKNVQEIITKNPAFAVSDKPGVVVKVMNQLPTREEFAALGLQLAMNPNLQFHFVIELNDIVERGMPGAEVSIEEVRKMAGANNLQIGDRLAVSYVKPDKLMEKTQNVASSYNNLGARTGDHVAILAEVPGMAEKLSGLAMGAVVDVPKLNRQNASNRNFVVGRFSQLFDQKDSEAAVGQLIKSLGDIRAIVKNGRYFAVDDAALSGLAKVWSALISIAATSKAA